MESHVSEQQRKVIDQWTNEVSKEIRSKTKRSREAWERARRFVAGGTSRAAVWSYFHPDIIYFSRGKGFTTWDLDGNSYLDFINNFTSLIHGHAHPKILKAIREVVEGGTASHWPTEHEMKLAEMLCDRFPCFDKVRFTNSGTEGTIHAMRLAIGFTGKDKIMKAEGGYHGTHISVDVSVAPELAEAGPIESPNSVLWPGTPRSVAKDIIIFPFNNKEITEKILRRNKDDLAAVIVEPMPRMLPPEDDFLKFLREITSQNDVLLIFDEVITGRLSRGGAQEYYGVTPDLAVLGKIYGGGTPFGAFGGRDDIMKLTDPTVEGYVHHSGTFQANPISMAAGIASTELLTPNAFEKLNSLGKIQTRGVAKVLDELGIIAHLAAEASLLSIFLTAEKVRDYRSALRSRDDLEALVYLFMHNKGVSLCRGHGRGLFSNISTVMTEREMTTFIDTFRAGMEWMKPLIKQTAPNLAAQ
jgi:glutamate-1-semialdehyde 2,1-aminomutase